MNLLIVEDNAKMRRMIKSIVADLADEIAECEDGGEALALYAAHPPDFVLMDIRMKQTDGIAATKKIIASFADAKIIIVTNHDDVYFRESAREVGAFDYILKENLLDVRRILQS